MLDFSHPVIITLAAINGVAFLVMMIDKIKAANGAADRISEGMMFFIGAAGGSAGIYLGMFAFRHKTKKWYFLAGMPLLMIQNYLSVVYFYNNIRL